MTYDLDFYYEVQNYFLDLSDNYEFFDNYYDDREGCQFTLHDHTTDKIYKNEEISEFLKAHKGELYEQTLDLYENLLLSVKEES